jgi:predicted amidophosphoribosyltransferase
MRNGHKNRARWSPSCIPRTPWGRSSRLSQPLANVAGVVSTGALEVLLGPQRCAGCGAPPALLCPGCAGRLARPQTCGAIPHVARTVAPWAYEGAARSLVLALKVRGQRSAARPLSGGMARAVAVAGLEAGVATWVPGRRADVRRRGFDHAEVLARGVAREFGLPVRPLVERAREPPDQAGLPAAARRKNLVGVFRARPWHQVVVLVDDVVTTGATAGACAAALRAGGAPAVEVLAACRA